MTRPRWPATTSAHRDSKISTISPIRSRETSLDSAVKATMSAKPDRELGGVEVLLVGAERLDPRHRRGEVAPPGVDQQVLERRVDLPDHAHRRVGPRPGGLVAALDLLDPVDQRRDLPVGEPGHRLADRAGQHHADVEVDRTRLDDPVEGRDGLGVGAGERDLGAVLREAERAPQPAQLVDGDTGLGRHLERAVDRLLAEDRALERDRVVRALVRCHRPRGDPPVGPAPPRRSSGPPRRAGCRRAGRGRARWRR